MLCTEENLPDGQNIKQEMQELAAVVARSDFKDAQIAFFERYANEFSEEDENKLAYTQIHDEYEMQVEERLEAALGTEKLMKISIGMAAYLKGEKGNLTPEAAEAVDVLSSLGDFTSFKQTMLMKKMDMNRKGDGLQITDKEIFEVPEVMDYIKKIRAEEGSAEWQKVVDQENMAIFLRQTTGGDTHVRSTVHLDLPPQHGVKIRLTLEPEDVEWRDGMKSIRVKKDWGPDDKVVGVGFDMSWAIKYILGWPDEMDFRVVTQKNWPEEGVTSFACIPYDVEKNINLEEAFGIKLMCGYVLPHPEGPDKCILTSIDVISMPWLPDFAVTMIYKAEMSKLFTSVVKYKKAHNFL